VIGRLTFRPSAQREFDWLDPSTRDRIQGALLHLAASPRQTADVKAMTDGNYRLRVGDWRVVFALRDDVLVSLVPRVGHRREVYR
jgi:mRNA interferase RelE/StbE